MNKKRLLMVANAIKNRKFKKLGFNMATYVGMAKQSYYPDRKDHSGHGCGTIACIAGWAVAVEHGVGYLKDDNNCGISRRARDFLDLTETQAMALFTPGRTNKYLRHITQDIAVTCLENLAETGKVNWVQARSDAKAARVTVRT